MNPNQATPPKLAQRFLRWFLRYELTEEVEGDLAEKFYQTLEEHSSGRAKRNYWYQVFHYLRPFAIKFADQHRLTGSRNGRGFANWLMDILRNKY